jgi:hypothetical protein
MDLSTTIIGLLLLSLFVVPIVLISRSGKSKAKRFEKELFSESSMNELMISEKTLWDEQAIGIDTAKNKIIYLNWSGPERIIYIFELKDVKIFETEPGFGERNKKNFSYKKSERLGLKFSFKDSVRQEINIIFFTPGIAQRTDDQVKMFEKWSKIIKDQLDVKPIGNLRDTA